jgi:AcrR family transcriptional regulator
VARPARFGEDVILDAALQVVAEHGLRAATTDAVADRMGGHAGSIYYRFPTKDHVLAALWIRCARIGQASLFEALVHRDLDEALDAAVLHYPRWSRTNPAPARILAAYSREQLTRSWPDDLATALQNVDNDLAAAMTEFTKRWYTDVTPARRRAMTFAVLDLPASAIRRYLLAGRTPPTSLDSSILAGARAALDAASRRPLRLDELEARRAQLQSRELARHQQDPSGQRWPGPAKSPSPPGDSNPQPLHYK